MAKTGFLQYSEDVSFLPITRGELVKDASGEVAFHSSVFEAKAPSEELPSGKPGLMSAQEKALFQSLPSGEDGVLQWAPFTLVFGTGDKDGENFYIYNGLSECDINITAGANVVIESMPNTIEISAFDPSVKSIEVGDTVNDNFPVMLRSTIANPNLVEGTYYALEHSYLHYNPSIGTLTVPYVDAIATSAQKIHYSTSKNGVEAELSIGSSSQPVYVQYQSANTGVITACSDTVGGENEAEFTPIYVNTGKFTAAAATIGGPTSKGFKLNYMEQGTFKEYKGQVGEDDCLIYVKDGIIQKSEATRGSGVKGVYLNKGNILPMTYTLNANVYSSTASNSVNGAVLATYTGPTAIGKSGYSTASNIPITIQDGVIHPIEVNKTTDTLYVTGVNSPTSGFYTGTQAPGEGVRILFGTTVEASGGFYEVSDETLKEFAGDITIDFNQLKKLPKKYFTWLADLDQKQCIGTSAQEVQKLYPELVITDSTGQLSVAYDKLSIIALKAIDDLYDLVVDLKASNDELKARIENLESK